MKRIIKITVAMLATLIIGSAAAGGVGVAMYFVSQAEAVDIDTAVEALRADENYTELSEADGEYLAAVVAVEDRRFFHHGGVDIVGIARAMYRGLASGHFSEGGSTITQQMARSLFLTQDRTLSRKLTEAFLALRLEREFSKDEILELYINSVYFGQNAYGIADASAYYCGKAPDELTYDEALMLAGIVQAPSFYSVPENAEYLAARSDEVEAAIENGFYIASMARHPLLFAAFTLDNASYLNRAA